jgi:hypothetical protein
VTFALAWSTKKRHQPLWIAPSIVHAYAAWRDAGMVVIDVADRTQPKLITHRNWSPPFGGIRHGCA